MTNPKTDSPSDTPSSVPVNPNGLALATLRPQFIPHPHGPDYGPATQYVLTRTLLGEEALTWSEPWLAGLFSLTEIMGWLPSAFPAWAQGLHEALYTARDLNPVREAAWEVVRRADPEGWTAINTLPPQALPDAFAESFSQVPLSEEAFGASIHGVVRWRDPVLVDKDARARKLLGLAKAANWIREPRPRKALPAG